MHIMVGASGPAPFRPSLRTLRVDPDILRNWGKARTLEEEVDATGGDASLRREAIANYFGAVANTTARRQFLFCMTWRKVRGKHDCAAFAPYFIGGQMCAFNQELPGGVDELEELYASTFARLHRHYRDFVDLVATPSGQAPAQDLRPATSLGAFDHLPEEVIDTIADQLPNRAIANLAQTHPVFDRIIGPKLDRRFLAELCPHCRITYLGDRRLPPPYPTGCVACRRVPNPLDPSNDRMAHGHGSITRYSCGHRLHPGCVDKEIDELHIETVVLLDEQILSFIANWNELSWKALKVDAVHTGGMLFGTTLCLGGDNLPRKIINILTDTRMIPFEFQIRETGHFRHFGLGGHTRGAIEVWLRDDSQVNQAEFRRLIGEQNLSRKNIIFTSIKMLA